MASLNYLTGEGKATHSGHTRSVN